MLRLSMLFNSRSIRNIPGRFCMMDAIVGGWTVDNSKHALDNYCQNNRLNQADYKITKMGPDHACVFIAESDLHLPRLSLTIHGRGQGPNLKVSKNSCAQSLVCQLFQIGAMPSADELQLASSKSSKSSRKSQPNSDSPQLPARKLKLQMDPNDPHYLARKAARSNKSGTSDDNGGWTLENGKHALDMFCQNNRLPAREYKITKMGPNHGCNYIATNELFLPPFNHTIHGRGEGFNVKVAKTDCALDLIRRLYEQGIIPTAEESGMPHNQQQQQLQPSTSSASTKSRDRHSQQHLQIRVHVDPQLASRIQSFLADSGIRPVEEGLDLATETSPRSLLVDQKLAEFAQARETPTSPTIVWGPPSPNWNAWKATTLGSSRTYGGHHWPLERISEDLARRERAKTMPHRIDQIRRALPVFQHREQIVRTVAESPVVLVKGATGCGKSTQICQYLLEHSLMASRGAHFNCYVTQPRRISAITLAKRVAYERFEQLGESAGYSVRFETVHPRPYGAIMFVTVGVLMRKLEMGLRGISHVIVDEIHERDIDTDFLLIVVRDMVRANPQLRVVLMSATIDTDLFTSFFDQCPVIEIQQRVHPVHHYFLEEVVNNLGFVPTGQARGESGGGENLLVCGDDFHPGVRQALARMTEQEIPVELIERLLVDIDANGRPGSVLVFLPGWNVISSLWRRLSAHTVFGDASRFVLLPLHSQLSAAEQGRVFEPVGRDQRKIILSTNIAETSVTIDDVVFVIDSCRVREKVFTSANNLVHFTEVWASRTNLIQRRGRAGRVQEGFCFHLVTRARFDALEEHRKPEMLRTPLHEIALTIKLLRLGPISQFLKKAVQPPPIDAVIEAESLLREMNALDPNMELTELGRILARLPIEPKFGKMLLLGAALGVGDLMLTAAAATSFNTPFIPAERMQNANLAPEHRSFSGRRLSDHIGLVNCSQQFDLQRNMYSEGTARDFCRQLSLSYPSLNMGIEAKRQLFDVLTKNSGLPERAFAPQVVDVNGPDPELDVFLSLLIAAYYPNICYKGNRRGALTLEGATVSFSNQSVCVPFRQIDVSSPLFVYTEKMKSTKENASSVVEDSALYSGGIICKQISMVSPLQLLLFGSRRVEAIGPEKVRLDNTIHLEMPARLAAQIVALRPCLEALVVRTCVSPEELARPSRKDHTFAGLVRDLSSETGWLPPLREEEAHDWSQQGQERQTHISRGHHDRTDSRSVSRKRPAPPPRVSGANMEPLGAGKALPFEGPGGKDPLEMAHLSRADDIFDAPSPPKLQSICIREEEGEEHTSKSEGGHGRVASKHPKAGEDNGIGGTLSREQ